MSDTLAPPLVPARMLNEYAYCPRLAYLEWVQGEWADNADTEEGRHAHRRVSREELGGELLHQRSLPLASERLGLTAVVDVIEEENGRVRPVDYKKGKRPDVPGGAYEPERVQLCAQGLLLREHGFQCDEGVLYFVASKQRVRVPFDDAMTGRTLELLREMRERLGSGTIPPPLEDSPKCPRCSLVGICLPEEVNFLRARARGKLRPLAVADPESRPLVVQEPGAEVRLDGGRFAVRRNRKVEAEARIEEVSQLVLMGGAHCSQPVLRECCDRGIPVLHMSGTGWFYGITHGLAHKNVELRALQFAAAGDPNRCLVVARSLVAAKIRNCRVLLRRNSDPPEATLSQLEDYARLAERAGSLAELLGFEGSAAGLYFEHFSAMLKGDAAGCGAFRFDQRTRRPARDPINALLSFAYALLAKDWAVTLYAVGFDPLMGLYHQPRYGKPSLALDLMEPFRPIVADSVVIGALNNGEVGAEDFTELPGSVALKPAARRRFLGAYERRLGQEIRHPLFRYRCTYRRVFEIQARLLGRWLLGEIPDYPAFRVR